MKIKCSKCDKIATWCYIPNCNEKTSEGFYCNDCVPRGCSCNLYDIEHDGEPNNESKVGYYSKDDSTFSQMRLNRDSNSYYYEYLDEQGRRFPCCEYIEDEDGFEKDENLEN